MGLTAEQKAARRAEQAALAVEGKRKCFKCGEIKEIADFSRNKGVADGYDNRCRQCVAELAAARRAKGGGLQSSIDEGKKQAKKFGRPWDDFTVEELEAYWRDNGMDPWICQYTGEALTRENRNLEHVHPLSDENSPGHVMSNVVAASASFNRRKRSRHFIHALVEHHGAELTPEAQQIEGKYTTQWVSDEE